MKIKYRKPLFWFLVKIFNPNAKWGEVILTFGDTIYTSRVLTAAQEAHEKIHLKQQHYSKLFAIYDSLRSLVDKEYYLKCEIEAYQVQNKIERNPQLYAAHLSSSIYNNLISYEEALKLFL